MEFLKRINYLFVIDIAVTGFALWVLFDSFTTDQAISIMFFMATYTNLLMYAKLRRKIEV